MQELNGVNFGSIRSGEKDVETTGKKERKKGRSSYKLVLEKIRLFK